MDTLYINKNSALFSRVNIWQQFVKTRTQHTISITVVQNIIFAPKMRNTIKLSIFFIASHIVITLQTLWSQKLSFLIYLLHFYMYRFLHWFMASFLYRSPYSCCSSKYCKSNIYCSFWHLKVIMRKVKENRKRTRKSDKYRESNQEKEEGTIVKN